MCAECLGSDTARYARRTASHNKATPRLLACSNSKNDRSDFFHAKYGAGRMTFSKTTDLNGHQPSCSDFQMNSSDFLLLVQYAICIPFNRTPNVQS